LGAAPNLLQKPDVLDLGRAIRAIGSVGLVIVDTFAQVTPGANENAGEDMGKALANCRAVHDATAATVVLVHHSGKDASKGARGWSGIKAAADAELEVVRTETGRALRVSKQKDGEDGLEFGFALDVVHLGLDEDGDPITSCVVVEAEMPRAVSTRPLGRVQAVVNEAAQRLLANAPSASVAAVVAEAVQCMPEPEDGKRDRRAEHVKRALDELCSGTDPLYRVDGDSLAPA
jgi:hypothetical protein